MEQDEVFYQMSEFICQQGLWEAFLNKLRAFGVTEDELEELELL